MKCFYLLLLSGLCLFSFSRVQAEEETAPTTVTVFPSQQKQLFHGMGCGTIFYSGHIASFSRRNKHKLQEQFYDDLFKHVQTHYLHLMIRPDYEEKNDNGDPYRPAFKEKAFESNRSAVEICAAAKKRRPRMRLYSTLYTPPAWMKTNGEESGGGKEKATLKPGLELELGEYIWAYLQHMKRNGHPVHYLSICNESDWQHSQPSYYLTPKQHARLFIILANYLDEMAVRYPDVPKPRLVAPNMLSAVDTAKNYWPALGEEAIEQVDVLGSHDYDRRGHRWKTLRELAGTRPLWCTEWCWNGVDTSPDLVKAASEFWLVMTEAFNDGANVWMAYDWAYPPRQGGEALTHVLWGQSYHKTRIYHGFSQWCNALVPGMRVVEVELTGPDATGISTPGVKASGFLDTQRGRLVVHMVNLQEKPASIVLRVDHKAYSDSRVGVVRTSTDDAQKKYPARRLSGDRLSDTFKPREMVTYLFPALR